MNLTARQKEVLKFVKGFIKKRGFPPTRAEISQGFGWASSNAAEAKLRELERKGFITISSGISRGIAIKERP